jgi:hypothetical protein
MTLRQLSSDESHTCCVAFVDRQNAASGLRDIRSSRRRLSACTENEMDMLVRRARSTRLSSARVPRGAFTRPLGEPSATRCHCVANRSQHIAPRYEAEVGRVIVVRSDTGAPLHSCSLCASRNERKRILATVCLPRVHTLVLKYVDHYGVHLLGNRQITTSESWRTSATNLSDCHVCSDTSPPYVRHKPTLNSDRQTKSALRRHSFSTIVTCLSPRPARDSYLNPHPPSSPILYASKPTACQRAQRATR